MSKLRYSTPEALAEAIDSYFAEVERAGAKPMIADMARHIGFQHRGTIAKYGKRPGFDYVVLMAKQCIEVDREQRLFDPNENTFAICRDLVNNHGWCWPEGWIDKRTGRLKKSLIPGLNNSFDRSSANALVDSEQKVKPPKPTATILKLPDRQQAATAKKNARASAA